MNCKFNVSSKKNTKTIDESETPPSNQKTNTTRMVSFRITKTPLINSERSEIFTIEANIWNPENGSFRGGFRGTT